MEKPTHGHNDDPITRAETTSAFPLERADQDHEVCYRKIYPTYALDTTGTS